MARSTSVACGCGSEMNVEKLGVTWVEQLENGSPYKLWNGDLLECKACQQRVVLLAREPYMIAHDELFAVELDRLRRLNRTIEYMGG